MAASKSLVFKNGRRIKVGLVDDHPIILLGLEQFLSQQMDIELVFSVSTIQEYLIRVKDSAPCDVLVIDFSMPDEAKDGFAWLRVAQETARNAKIILFTSQLYLTKICQGKNVGVCEIIYKGDSQLALLESIRTAADIEGRVKPEMEACDKEANRLTKKEWEVLLWIAEGMSVSEIASKKQRSIKTISTQKRSVMKKLGIKNDFGLMSYLELEGIAKIKREPK
ncbi:DNA-binding response regulator, NarL/FixJ family [Chromobacterium violaceum]|uniref:Capsular synthesis regulator component B n=2 Tax=Chromobacterium violaceum TaxID=536 RepID=A0A202B5U0_CHRVL|nr:response regulator transcription factor [Chromobacterium violaceum]MBA8735005.1 response regulator transcription factor [Chromobacterium violaceum]MBP4050081.1 response regulator transcription factor [Chromobacterium violaceum]MBT2866814.1 response regulator transcription factor [Chromobacterium violaceum]MBX9265488.1 response regulator transcription factor [Chromobacterium violaceum]MCD0493234.1 response regulator transcription factor [Chromobacterium violaceum]